MLSNLFLVVLVIFVIATLYRSDKPRASIRKLDYVSRSSMEEEDLSMIPYASTNDVLSEDDLIFEEDDKITVIPPSKTRSYSDSSNVSGVGSVEGAPVGSCGSAKLSGMSGKCLNDMVDRKVRKSTWNKLLGKHVVPKCPSDEVESVCMANKRHFEFRDRVWQDSHQEDAVDRIHRLYLEGNGSVARGNRGKLIGELFDEITAGTPLYERTCVRTPDFADGLSVKNEGYYGASGKSGAILNGQMSNYHDDHLMNGMMYGYDASASNQLPFAKLYTKTP